MQPDEPDREPPRLASAPRLVAWARSLLYATFARAFVAFWAAALFWPDPDASKFLRSTTDAAVIGRTEQQVVATLGTPADRPVVNDGQVACTFRGPGGHYCRVTFENDRVTAVARWEK